MKMYERNLLRDHKESSMSRTVSTATPALFALGACTFAVNFCLDFFGHGYAQTHTGFPFLFTAGFLFTLCGFLLQLKNRPESKNATVTMMLILLVAAMVAWLPYSFRVLLPA